MKPYFSVGEAAKAVHTTIETLRDYDRIGLVKPSKMFKQGISFNVAELRIIHITTQANQNRMHPHASFTNITPF